MENENTIDRVLPVRSKMQERERVEELERDGTEDGAGREVDRLVCGVVRATTAVAAWVYCAECASAMANEEYCAERAAAATTFRSDLYNTT